MKSKGGVMAYVVLLTISLGIFLWYLPNVLNGLGLHPDYKGVSYVLPGARVLIVTTSQSTLGSSGKATGVFASEMTAPYYVFVDAGSHVDIASVKGGGVPIEPDSLKWFLSTPSDKRYLKDRSFQSKVTSSLKIDDVDFKQYDIIFLAGGWGAAYDLGTSEVLGQKISQAWAAAKVIGGVCHGPLGLLLAKDTNGQALVKGKRLTAVTDRQVKQLGITITPQHPERELRAAGALFESRHAFFEPFANHAVVDGRLVTGQNQNAGIETAQLMLRVAGGKPRDGSND